MLLAGDGTDFSWIERWALTSWSGVPLESEAGVLFNLRDPDEWGFISFGSAFDFEIGVCYQ